MKKEASLKTHFRRAVSVTLSSLLLSSSLAFGAGKGKDWFAIPYQNITPPSANGGTWKDGASVSGGSIEYRFSNENVDWSPIVDWEAPSIKAGCNSLSLSGGFASFLGLENIAEQLANAGSAVIWGILIALVNSLPSFEHVFSKIKEIINWVSSMLRNACNMGKAIGNSMLSNTEWGKKYSGAMNTAQDWLNNLDSDIPTSFMDKSPSQLADDIVKSFQNAGGDTTGEKSGKVAKEFRENAKSLFVVGQLISSIMNSAFEDADNAQNGYIGFEEYEVDDSSNDRKAYLVVANILGEESISEGDAKQLLSESPTLIPELVATGKVKDAGAGSKKEQELKAFADKLANQLKNSPNSEIMNFDNPLPANANDDDFINKLLNGGEFKIKKIQAIRAYADPTKADGGKNSGKKLYFLMPYKFGKEITINWDGGLRKDSLDVIKCHIGASASNCNSDTKILLPDAQQKLETIKRYVAIKMKGAKTENDQKMVYAEGAVESLAKTLANYNAYFYAKHLISTFKNRIESQMNKSNNIEKSGKIEDLRKKLDVINGWLAKLDTYTIADETKMDNVNKIFDELDEKIRLLTAKETVK